VKSNFELKWPPEAEEEEKVRSAGIQAETEGRVKKGEKREKDLDGVRPRAKGGGKRSYEPSLSSELDYVENNRYSKRHFH